MDRYYIILACTLRSEISGLNVPEHSIELIDGVMQKELP